MKKLERLFIPLDPDWSRDDKVCKLGLAAGLTGIGFFHSCIGLSFGLRSDGHLEFSQIYVHLAGYASRDDVVELIDTLVAVGLFEPTGDQSWVMPGYLKNNPSSAEIADRKLRQTVGGELGVHKRRHQTKRDDECPWCQNPSVSFDDVLAMRKVGARGTLRGTLTPPNEKTFSQDASYAQGEPSTPLVPPVYLDKDKDEYQDEDEETQLLTPSVTKTGASPTVANQSQPQPTFDPDLQGLRTAIAQGVLNPAGGPRLDDYTHTISPRGITAARACFPNLQTARPEQIRTIYHSQWSITLTPTTNGATP